MKIAFCESMPSKRDFLFKISFSCRFTRLCSQRLALMKMPSDRFWFKMFSNMCQALFTQDWAVLMSVFLHMDKQMSFRWSLIKIRKIIIMKEQAGEIIAPINCWRKNCINSMFEYFSSQFFSPFFQFLYSLSKEANMIRKKAQKKDWFSISFRSEIIDGSSCQASKNNASAHVFSWSCLLYFLIGWKN